MQMPPKSTIPTTDRALTDDEHHARAMLLGRVYVPDLRAYSNMTGVVDCQDLDANTLEVMTYDEYIGRVIASLKDHEKP